MSGVSRWAISQIGHDVRVEASKHGKPLPQHSGAGVVVGVEATDTTIWDGNQAAPGVRFEIRREDGSRFWTVTMPDRTEAGDQR